MLYQTLDFLLFAIPVLTGFWLLAGRPVARVLFLLVASYFFYMAGPKTEPPPAPWYFVGLLVFSTFLDFWCGRFIHAFAEAAKSKDEDVKARASRMRNLGLGLSLLGNLGLLGYFKYANFFFSAFSDMAGALGFSVEAIHLDVILPLGISFYTFQSLSYTIDIWRGKLEPEPSFRRFALFVSFFPQLVAGPIVRASQFLPQLHRGPRFSREDIESGAFRIVRGLVKKVVLGDWIAGQLTDRIFDQPETFTSPELMIALYAYTLQIYADFSGYSDMAIGLGRMLGFKLPENFDRPYQSRDIAEYWRRWHMTLSTWLRDYLFFQILARMGARYGSYALWLTMFLVGMWHGASWNFVIYANIHAFGVVFNRWTRARRPELGLGQQILYWAWRLGLGIAVFGVGTYWALQVDWLTALYISLFFAAVVLLVCHLPTKGGPLVNVTHIFITFHLVVLARIFFRARDIDNSRAFVGQLLTFDHFTVRPGLAAPWVWAALVFGLAYHFTPKRWIDEIALKAFRRTPGVILGLLFAALLFGLMKLVEGQPRAFIYFQF